MTTPTATQVKKIGRSMDCDLLVIHPTISRHHAEAWIENGSIMIQDLGSKNGTWVKVNGGWCQITAPTTLQPGLKFRLGPLEIAEQDLRSKLLDTRQQELWIL